MLEKRAIVLFSGGVLSTTALKFMINQGYDIVTLTFVTENQPQEEIFAIEKICESFNVKECVFISLEGANVDSSSNKMLLSLSYAGILAEEYEAQKIVTGICMDNNKISDNPIFFDLFEKTLNFCLDNNKITIMSPLEFLTKKQVLKWGIEDLGINYKDTVSCLNPKNSNGCRICNKCIERRTLFSELNIIDSVSYDTSNLS